MAARSTAAHKRPGDNGQWLVVKTEGEGEDETSTRRRIHTSHDLVLAGCGLRELGFACWQQTLGLAARIGHLAPNRLPVDRPCLFKSPRPF